MEYYYKGIVISHTHWDREWYLSFQEFRKWLVLMIDDLLDNFKTHPNFKSFQMDGQTVVLEDYLDIRPERKEDLQSAIQSGKLIIGPFYVLADEFLESGEGLIRNLLLGHKISNQFGTEPMKVGYVPDTFGHIWQLPQILNGFDIDSMYYWRGYPPLFGNWEEYAGKNDKTPLEHFYKSPDGSKVLTLHHLVGYGNASELCSTPSKEETDDDFPYMNAIFKIGSTFDRSVPRQKSNLILFMNGGDHQQAEWNLPDLISCWNKNEELLEDFPVLLEHGTMVQYFSELKRKVEEGLILPEITGEARGSAYTQVTPGCISTRMNLKLLNWKCSMELEKYAEPFSTLNWLLGGRYQAPYIEMAWKWLIKNHPHDSICGCSLDRVHEDMITRFNWSYDCSSDVTNYSFASLLSGIPMDIIKSDFIQNHKEISTSDIQVIGIFNPNPFEGPFVVSGLVNLNTARHYSLYDHSGQQIEDVYIEYIPDYRVDIKTGQYNYKKFKRAYSLGNITAIIDGLPAMGYKTFLLVAEDSLKIIDKRDSWESIAVKTPFLNVTFNLNGSINIEDLCTKLSYNNLNLYEDGADDGDEYDWAPLRGDIPLTSESLPAKFSLISENKVFSEIEAILDFPIPFELIGNAESIRKRSQVTKIIKIKTRYKVYRNIKRVDVCVDVVNQAKGHRLRALFPSGISSRYSFADDHFMVMQRTVELPKDDGWFQDMQGIYHQDKFVDVNNSSQGLAIFNRGNCEYEIIDCPGSKNNANSTIALTLYRSVAWLSQNGHLGRKSGLNGPNLQTPGAQMMGHDFHFEYSIFPHSGDWETSQIYRAAHGYNSPPRLFSERHYLRNETLVENLSNEFSLLSIDNPSLVLSCVKRTSNFSNGSDGMILRIFNPTHNFQAARINFGLNIKNCGEVNMLETDINVVSVEQSKSINFEVRPYQISSLRVEFMKN